MEENILRLSTFRISDSRIEIHDRKRQQIIKVMIIDGDLFCSNCKTDECIHVGYALGIEERKKMTNASQPNFMTDRDC